MILVTGAAGKTGRAVIGALRFTNEPVRALARRAGQEAALRALGAADVVVGDLCDAGALRQAMEGVRAVYHISPNMHPDETAIGRAAVDAARQAGVERFIYHSVLHPQTEAMPHHWNKLRVEEALLGSGLAFTILQPAVYMQNVLAGLDRVRSDGVYSVPYPVATRLSYVDLEDVGEAAATVLGDARHAGATYELAGTLPMSQAEVGQALARALGRPVRAESQSQADWERQARAGGLSEYAVTTLLAMFRYYEQHGLPGNPNVLAWLLGRPPADFATAARRVSGKLKDEG
jgi:NAD(P)H dehydrogenase (quinone)